jgi:carbonic anhydrase/acetyltransferase-like protein (isoleucine patch superfamily)
MILGRPAKVVRQLTAEQIEGLRLSARNYVANTRRFRTGLSKIA